MNLLLNAYVGTHKPGNPWPMQKLLSKQFAEKDYIGSQV